MKAKFDHDLHIHSYLSLCAGHPEQTKENILKYAQKHGLHTICVTDHFWSGKIPGAWSGYDIQNMEYLEQIKPLPQTDDVRFLFGCEAELDKNGRIVIAPEEYDVFDFIIIPTTHFHMRNNTVCEEDLKDFKTKAKVWIKRLDTVLDRDLPFHKIGLAHLTTTLIEPKREDLLQFIEEISVPEMYRVFKKAASVGIGIELNPDGMNFTDEDADIMLKPYRIAKECGCKFYFGSDAHTPEGLTRVKVPSERAIEFLELEDSDLFKI